MLKLTVHLSDPQNTRTDAEILSALRRTWLLPAEGSPVDKVTTAKFSLDSTVSDEGSNYSAGEKQWLALCRALVKNSRIIVLVSDVRHSLPARVPRPPVARADDKGTLTPIRTRRRATST